MGSIIYQPSKKNCQTTDCWNYNKKCCMDTIGECRLIDRLKYQGLSDFASAYYDYTTRLKRECYARKYKHGYILLVNGMPCKDKSVDSKWHILFFREDTSESKHILSTVKEIVKNNKRYLFVGANPFGLPKQIPLSHNTIVF